MVGGLNYTKHLILTSATSQLLEENGYTVDQRDGLGTSVLRQAQENGQVDLCWEYTGNSVILFHDQEQPANAEETYRQAKTLDADLGLI
ncbi:glycine betaine ABC transporter substrate-binding protein [Aidingimonas lacisalsi]|uniref:glycine betaine ABC transporter substrate-binding protein n=1 Tax=Aidingimonas lacisalsi TaxID=2604086 RepID=UPI001F457EA3|nr:glycine betaine ABC transporter substrate-binding protein [Aidingimonas lacisalsi]